MNERTQWPCAEPSDWTIEVLPGAEADTYVLTFYEQGTLASTDLASLKLSQSAYNSIIPLQDRLVRMGALGEIELTIDQEFVHFSYNGKSNKNYADEFGRIAKISRTIFRQGLESANISNVHYKAPEL